MYGKHDYSQWSDSQNADSALFKLIKPTNVDIKDAACLYMVYIWQHPTSRPTTRSTQEPMGNALKKNLSPLPVGNYSKSTKKFTGRRHQANKGKSGMETEMH